MVTIANNFDEKLRGLALWLEPVVMVALFFIVGFILA
jgi:type II secretory pathway component PulF